MHACKGVTAAHVIPQDGTRVHAYDNVAEAQIRSQDDTHTIIHDGVCDVCFSVWFSSGLHPSLLDAAARDVMQKSRTGLSDFFLS